MRPLIAALLAALMAGACAAPARRPPPPAAAPAANPPFSVEAVGDDPRAIQAAVRQAYAAGDYVQGLALVKHLLEVSPDKVTAYDRIGSTYFALGRDGEALGMWETALALEKDPKRKADLAASVALARRSLGLPEPAAPAGQETPAKTAPRPRATRRHRRDPKKSERLYQEGVAKYADGQYLAATALFMKALELDPDNDGARKALERLRLSPPAP